MRQRNFLGTGLQKGIFICMGIVLLAVACIATVLVLRPDEKTMTVRVGEGTFRAKLATSEKTRAKGLSGKTHLAENEAMLFVNASNNKNMIWMKDMKIAIDALWLDENQTVIHVERSLKPDSYPKTYGPDTPTRYVLEVADGTLDKVSIRVGMHASIMPSNEEVL